MGQRNQNTTKWSNDMEHMLLQIMELLDNQGRNQEYFKKDVMTRLSKVHASSKRIHQNPEMDLQDVEIKTWTL